MRSILILIHIIFSHILIYHHCNGYQYESGSDKSWNPLQFPSAKLFTIITFDDIGWNEIINQPDTIARDKHISSICKQIQQCLHDATGYTLQSMKRTPISIMDKSNIGSNINTPYPSTPSPSRQRTQSTTIAPTITTRSRSKFRRPRPTKTYPDSSNRDSSVSARSGSSDSSSGSSSRRRLLSSDSDDSDSSEDGYDALLNGKISFKNIEKSLLSESKKLNYTFGILFNDIDIYDEFKSIIRSNDYLLLNSIYHQCMSLTIDINHVHLHLISMKAGMFEKLYEDDTYSPSPTMSGDIDIDTDTIDGGTRAPMAGGNIGPANGINNNDNNIEYKVMITLNEQCLISENKQNAVDGIIDDIVTFYSDCLSFKNGQNEDIEKYKTYKVSDVGDMVYFFKIVDNDKSCLITIDMEYLNSKCVDMIEYEPIYELDILFDNNPFMPTSPVNVQCETQAVDRWNLDFFDGREDGFYRVLENEHIDHGIDQYILDTGILSSHEVFDHNQNQNLVYIHQLRLAGNINDPPVTTQQFIPSHFHGTYVAGIAGGDIYGISRNFTIYDYEVCVGSACSYSKVLAGIEAVKVNMITTGRRGVINLSFGGPISATNTLARRRWDHIMKGLIDAGGIPVCSGKNTIIFIVFSAILCILLTLLHIKKQ